MCFDWFRLDYEYSTERNQFMFAGYPLVRYKVRPTETEWNKFKNIKYWKRKKYHRRKQNIDHVDTGFFYTRLCDQLENNVDQFQLEMKWILVVWNYFNFRWNANDGNCCMVCPLLFITLVEIKWLSRQPIDNRFNYFAYVFFLFFDIFGLSTVYRSQINRLSLQLLKMAKKVEDIQRQMLLKFSTILNANSFKHN